MPAAMPSWRAVLLTPDAMPLWDGGTTASAATVIVGFTRPEPAPQTTRPGQRWAHEPCGPMPRIPRRPPAHRSSPPASALRTLKRAATWAASNETTNDAAANGSSSAPAAIGEPPSTRISSCVMKTIGPKPDAANSSATTVAATNVRLRINAGAMSGCATRCSTTTNSANAAAATSAAPTTTVEPQPRWPPSSSANTDRNMATVSAAVPARSMPGASVARDSRAWRAATAAVGTASTRPTRKAPPPQRGGAREPPPPRERLDEDAPDERSERDRGRHRRAPHADRPGALRTLELGRDQGQRGREQHRRAEPLDAAAGDQHRARAGERGDRAAGGEDGEAEEEQPFAAEPVAERAARQKEAREDERVAREHPLLGGEGQPEVARDRGERDVRRGHVEQQQRRRRAHHREGPALAPEDPAGVRMRRRAMVVRRAAGVRRTRGRGRTREQPRAGRARRRRSGGDGHGRQVSQPRQGAREPRSAL